MNEFQALLEKINFLLYILQRFLRIMSVSKTRMMLYENDHHFRDSSKCFLCKIRLRRLSRTGSAVSVKLSQCGIIRSTLLPSTTQPSLWRLLRPKPSSSMVLNNVLPEANLEPIWLFSATVLFFSVLLFRDFWFWCFSVWKSVSSNKHPEKAFWFLLRFWQNGYRYKLILSLAEVHSKMCSTCTSYRTSALK